MGCKVGAACLRLQLNIDHLPTAIRSLDNLVCKPMLKASNKRIDAGMLNPAKAADRDRTYSPCSTIGQSTR